MQLNGGNYLVRVASRFVVLYQAIEFDTVSQENDLLHLTVSFRIPFTKLRDYVK